MIGHYTRFSLVPLFTRLFAALLVALLMPGPPVLRAAVQTAQPAAEQATPGGDETIDPAIQKAVDDAVAYLMSRQNPDGSISPGPTHATALTSLAILSMVGVGHLPTDPTPQGESLRRALQFILSPDRQDEQGYFGQRDGSRMYGHGITTLMLSELIGMGVDAEQDALMRRKLEAAIRLILQSQDVDKAEHYQGGWRYIPTSFDSDLSVTVWQVMALRSASQAGVEVPASAVERAVEFLRRSFSETENPEEGIFRYQPTAFTFGYATTAAGVLAMQVCGRYDADEVTRGTAWLMNRPLDRNDRWFFYGTYYYAQGMEQRGGETARLARQRVQTALLPSQNEDGSFSGGGYAEERVYATSMALMSLSVRYHYLPIYQR